MTPTQAKVRDFILEYQAKHHERPLYKQIMAALGIRSLRTVHKTVKKLEKTGELRLEYVTKGKE